MPAEISNEALQLGDIPSPDGCWDEIGAFALTFNGYEFWGSFEKCGVVANERRHETIADLRTCLFFEQRRWRHFGEEPDTESLEYVRSLVAEIRRRLAGRRRVE